MNDRECLWNTKCEQRRHKTARENALHETVRELNFPELIVEDVKFKVKPIRSRYTAELTKAMK
jgi:hypothetical protein